MDFDKSVAYIDKIETDFFVEEDNNKVQGNPFKSLKDEVDALKVIAYTL